VGGWTWRGGVRSVGGGVCWRDPGMVGRVRAWGQNEGSATSIPVLSFWGTFYIMLTVLYTWHMSHCVFISA